MESITKNSNALFVLFLGILISFSVSGQMVKNSTFRDVYKPKSQFLKNNPAQSFFNAKPGTFPPAFKSTLGSLPQEIHHFYWDGTTNWIAAHNEYRAYNNHGDVLTEISVDANSGDTTSGIVNTYDTQGRLVESLNQIWNNGAWENSSKTNIEYDEMGNQTIMLDYIWDGGTWMADYGYKYEYTYDVNNNITIVIFQLWIMASWENSDKTLNTYDASGNWTESVYQEWDPNTNNWKNSDKEIYTYSSDVIVEVLLQEWVINIPGKMLKNIPIFYGIPGQEIWKKPKWQVILLCFIFSGSGKMASGLILLMMFMEVLLKLRKTI